MENTDKTKSTMIDYKVESRSTLTDNHKRFKIAIFLLILIIGLCLGLFVALEQKPPIKIIADSKQLLFTAIMLFYAFSVTYLIHLNIKWEALDRNTKLLQRVFMMLVFTAVLSFGLNVHFYFNNTELEEKINKIQNTHQEEKTELEKQLNKMQKNLEKFIKK